MQNSRNTSAKSSSSTQSNYRSRQTGLIFAPALRLSSKLQIPDPPSPPPVILAQAWAVAQGRSGRIIFGKDHLIRRQIASITKIMTCYVVIRCIQLLNLDLDNYLQVSKQASRIGGTSARLQPGEQIQIWDLLHGLMLPSGNDAAICLAQNFGRLFAVDYGDSYDCDEPVRYFVRQMNLTAWQMGLRDTNYCNPHGMSTTKNTSNIKDICRLASISMKNQMFRAIVSTSRYSCYVLQANGCSFRKISWNNTNELLGQGFCGIKTGVTRNAGPCLCACVRRDSRVVIAVVLGAITKDQRWMDVPKLADWGFSRLG